MRHPLGLYYMALILLVGHIMCREAMKRAPPAVQKRRQQRIPNSLFLFQ